MGGFTEIIISYEVSAVSYQQMPTLNFILFTLNFNAAMHLQLITYNSYLAMHLQLTTYNLQLQPSYALTTYNL